MEIERELVSQLYQRRIGGGCGAVGAEARRIDPGQSHRDGLAQAELGLEPVGGRRDIAHPVAAAVERQGHARDLIWRDPVLLAQAAGAFDRSVRQITGSVVLEQIGEDMKPVRRCRERRLRIEIRAVGQRETLLAFDKVGAAGKTARGEARREQPALRGLAGVERLAHRAELRFEPGRLGAGDAERARRSLGIEAEQPRAGGRGAKAADRPGGVKAAVVMAGPHRHSDPASGLVAGDERSDDVAPGASALFGERDQPRQDRDRGMAGHRQIDVVVIERMADGAVDQRGREGGEAHLMADHAGLRHAAGLGQFVEQNGGERVVRPGERDAVIIEHALPR